MKSFGTQVLTVLLTFWAPVIIVNAATARLDPTLSCSIHAGPGQSVRQGGILTLALEFENNGPPRVLKVSTAPYPRVSATFRLPAESTTKHCVYVPVPAQIQHSLRVLEFFDDEAGSALPAADLSQYTYRLSYEGTGAQSSPPNLLAIAISESRTFAINEGLVPGFAVRSQKVSVAATPDSWIGYSGLDLIVLDYDVWASPGIDRQPFVDWISMGGVCLLVDTPAEAREEVRRLLASSVPFLRYGANDRYKLLAGMGALTFVNTQFLITPQKEFLRDLPLKVLDRTANYGNVKVPDIPGIGNPPFWPILAFLAVFGVLAGPLGWWYLVSKKRRGIMYYVLAPAMSTCVIASLIAINFLHEGVRTHVSCITARFLDQKVNRLIELSQFGAYAPLGIGEPAGPADELPHLLTLAGPWASPGRLSSLAIVTSGDNRTYGGVLSPRQKAWFGREAIRLERKRLLVWQEDHAIFVENHLGYPLENLLVNHRGKSVYLESLPPGAKRAATELDPGRVRSFLRSYEHEFQTMASSSILQKAMAMRKELWGSGSWAQDNRYVAEVPGRATGIWLSSYKTKASKSLVFGIF